MYLLNDVHDARTAAKYLVARAAYSQKIKLVIDAYSDGSEYDPYRDETPEDILCGQKLEQLRNEMKPLELAHAQLWANDQFYTMDELEEVA